MATSLDELRRHLEDRWKDLVDRVVGWLQPEPEPVPVPVRAPSADERRRR